MALSSIEWTDYTFNPWIGCAKVSAGCKNCYAETLMDTRYGRVEWGVNGTRVRTSENYWKQPLHWNKEAGRLGIRYSVFCASLADVFEDRPELEPWRNDLFRLIDATPHLDWLLLTKRPENVRRMWPEQLLCQRTQEYAYNAYRQNVSLGASVEDQDTANARVPALVDMRFMCRFLFLSCEPLLGPVDLTSIPMEDAIYVRSMNVLSGHGQKHFDPVLGLRLLHIDGVIVGGESGGELARPLHPDWVRSLRDQCAGARVKFLFKQWGESRPATPADPPTKVHHRFMFQPGGSVQMVRDGKHRCGRLLDGVVHDATPWMRGGILQPN